MKTDKYNLTIQLNLLIEKIKNHKYNHFNDLNEKELKLMESND